MTNRAFKDGMVLEGYVKRVNRALEDNLEMLGPNSLVREACVYALSTGGKRVRPSIALMVADSLGHGGDALLSALGVEYFHTASLIADDMPSLDDDDERRCCISVHKKFGEAVALLATYALIASGYGLISKNAKLLVDQQVSFLGSVDHRCYLALKNASFNTGLHGAVGGQLLDIHPPDLSVETIKMVIHQKTSSLFEIAFVYGWLFGGGDLERLLDIKQAAGHFGLAFQIADDFQDQKQDLINKREVNLANVLGRDGALKMFHEELDSFLLLISDLGLDRSLFREVLDSIATLGGVAK